MPARNKPPVVPITPLEIATIIKELERYWHVVSARLWAEGSEESKYRLLVRVLCVGPRLKDMPNQLEAARVVGARDTPDATIAAYQALWAALHETEELLLKDSGH